MNQATAPEPDKADILAEAFANAGRYLGLSQADLGEIVGMLQQQGYRLCHFRV